MRRLTVFNLVSLEGHFAGPGGDISWHLTEGAKYPAIIKKTWAEEQEILRKSLKYRVSDYQERLWKV